MNRLASDIAPRSPRAAGFSQTPDWAPHRSCWLAWPTGEELWGGVLGQVREEFAALCAAIAGPGGEEEGLEILVRDQAQEQEARAVIQGPRVAFHRAPYGDIWLRDTGPVFVQGATGERACVCFAFNGWGGRYIYPGDEGVSRLIARACGLPSFEQSLVYEGGAVDVDGEGSCLTARDCLLSPARNPGVAPKEVEEQLRQALGVERVLWLSGSLQNDHTDGHADTVARFVAPGRVLCMRATDPDDPNAELLEEIARQLNNMVDARGRRLEVQAIPSPGLVTAETGEVMPASYLNFYLANRAVVVPVYGATNDQAAVEAIGRAFPGRRAIGVSARAILHGGGAFHCITVAEPAGPATPTT